MSGGRKYFNFQKDKHCKLVGLTMMTCKIQEWIINLIICKHLECKKKKKRLANLSQGSVRQAECALPGESRFPQ